MTRDVTVKSGEAYHRNPNPKRNARDKDVSAVFTMYVARLLVVLFFSRVMDAVMRFFGIHDDEEERELWRARQEHYLRRRLLPKDARRPQRQAGVPADDVFVQPGADVVDGVEMEPVGQRNRTSSTGRTRDKTREPEHRLRPSMPSVVSMVMSGFRTVLKVSTSQPLKSRYLNCLIQI